VATKTVADHLLGRLREWGVDTVFAYPGDGINGLLAAWGRADNRPQFVQARHEEMAAFEAVGYAKFTGRLGVCAATSGPGAIHLLNGLYDAKLDHVPVVAIVGQTNRSAIGGSYQQEVDLLSLFKDVASDYLQMVTVPEQLPNVLDRAIRTALARRAPTDPRVQNGAFQPRGRLARAGTGLRCGAAGGGNPQRGQQSRDPGRLRSPRCER
jgi:pyruvate dehydrogenase (quinone)